MKESLIYLVDNDLISKFEIEVRLRQSKWPCKIISFGDAISAFKMLDSDFGQKRDCPPDILIVNLDLPGMDGLSFLEDMESNDLICENTSLYIFSDTKITNERKYFDKLKKLKGFFIKPPSKKDIDKIFESHGEATVGR